MNRMIVDETVLLSSFYGRAYVYITPLFLSPLGTGRCARYMNEAPDSTSRLVCVHKLRHEPLSQPGQSLWTYECVLIR